MSSIWINHILNRIKQKKNFLGLFLGESGSGKSWAAISFAEELARQQGLEFKAEHICLTLKDMLYQINYGKLPPGSPLCFDEWGVSMGSRNWQSKDNIDFGTLLQVIRHRQLIMLFSVPFKSLVDKAGRLMVHSEFHVIGRNDKLGLCYIKPFILELSERENTTKVYRKYLRYTYKNEYGFEITDMEQELHIPRPSPKLCEEYEAKAKKFKDKLAIDLYNKEKDTDKSEGPSNKKRTVYDKIEMLELSKQGFTYEKIAKRMNCSIKTVQRYIKGHKIAKISEKS